MSTGQAHYTFSVDPISPSWPEYRSPFRNFTAPLIPFLLTFCRSSGLLFDSPRPISQRRGKTMDEDTRAVFCESVGNPAGNICDLEALANLAHQHGVPLMVDNTVATPVLLRPFEYGADIVVHSLTEIPGRAWNDSWWHHRRQWQFPLGKARQTLPYVQRAR